VILALGDCQNPIVLLNHKSTCSTNLKNTTAFFSFLSAIDFKIPDNAKITQEFGCANK